MNKSYVICNKTDENFKKHCVYNVIGLNNLLAIVMNENGKANHISIEDNDFTFVFNYPEDKLNQLDDFAQGL